MKKLKLKNFIYSKNKSLLYVSKRLGICHSTFSAYVNAQKPFPLKHQKKAAKLLGITLEEFKDLLTPEVSMINYTSNQNGITKYG